MISPMNGENAQSETRRSQGPGSMRRPDVLEAFRRLFGPGFSLAFFGIGLYRLWYQFNFYNLHFSADMGLVTAGANIARVTVIALMVFALARRGSNRASRAIFVWSGFVLMTLSGLLYLIDVFFGSDNFEVLRAVVGGIGLVGGEVMWLFFLERATPARCFFYVGGGLALSCALSLVMGYLNPEVAAMVNLFVPALSVFAYWRAMRLEQWGDDDGWQAMPREALSGASRGEGVAKGRGRLGWGRQLTAVVAACFLFAFLLGMALGYPDGRLREMSQGVRSAHQVLVVLVVVATIWWALVRGRGFDFSAYWMFQNVLMMVSVCLLMSKWSGAHEASTFFATNAMTCFYLPLVYFICQMARELRQPAALVYAVVYGGALLCMAVGRLAVHVVGPAMVLDSGHNLTLLVAMAVVVLVECTLGLAAMRMGGVGSLGWGLARGDASLSVLVPVAEVAPARECPTGDDGAEAPVAGSGLLGKAPAGEPMRDGGCSRGAGDDPVAALADAYGLTETEAAIVRLIAQGRSRSYIAQALSYSENTIRNYTRTVYRKAAVHSKQELLDKLE